jgi:hypothetical protein
VARLIPILIVLPICASFLACGRIGYQKLVLADGGAGGEAGGEGGAEVSNRDLGEDQGGPADVVVWPDVAGMDVGGQVDADAGGVDTGGGDSGGDASLDSGGDARADAADAPIMGDVISPRICRRTIALEQRDTDGDGILDVYDPDDDNDGIPDLVECFSGPMPISQNDGFESPVIRSFTNTTPGDAYLPADLVPPWISIPPAEPIEIWESGFQGIRAARGAQFIELNADSPNAVFQDVATTPGLTYVWAVAHQGRQGFDTAQVRVGVANQTVLQRQFSTPPGAWRIYAGTYLVPAGQTVTRYGVVAVSPAGSVGNFVDDATFFPLCMQDTDGDGCVDSEDLDSDGNGIPDRP